MSTIYVTDANTGQLVAINTDNPSGSLSVIDADTGEIITIDLSSPSGTIHVVDADTGEIVELDYSSLTGTLHVVDANTGDIVEVDFDNPSGLLYVRDENTGDLVQLDLSSSLFVNANGVIIIGESDSTPPTVAITLSDYSIITGDTPTVTFTFSEEVMNFTVADITAPNGSLSSFTVTANPLIYTATFTPTSGVVDATNVITVGTNWTDLNGNPPAGSTNSSNYTVMTITPPTQPANLTATPVSTSQINLAWTDASSDETAFKVYRSTDGSSYSQVGTDLVAGTQAYNDTTITAGVKYYYKVAATNAGGETLSDAVVANTLTLSLSAYWKLDETSDGSGAVTRNDSVGSNHLTDNNTTASATGKISNGADFEKDNSEFLSRANVSAVSPSGDFTIVFWAKAESNLSGVQAGFASYWGTNDSWRIQYNSSGGSTRMQIHTQSPTEYPSISRNPNYANDVGVWHLYIFEHDSAAKKLSIQLDNGSITQSTSYAGTLVTANNTFLLGRDSETSFFDGIIDEFGFWSRLLTTSERAALYNSGAGQTYPF